ncbi:NAD-dependent protein deacetylase Sirt2 [Diplonema papillatum]|nr:NAD-dependent protein deacetylase Sirt2 [Diplonema papillatum]
MVGRSVHVASPGSSAQQSAFDSASPKSCDERFDSTVPVGSGPLPSVRSSPSDGTSKAVRTTSQFSGADQPMSPSVSSPACIPPAPAKDHPNGKAAGTDEPSSTASGAPGNSRGRSFSAASSSPTTASSSTGLRQGSPAASNRPLPVRHASPGGAACHTTQRRRPDSSASGSQYSQKNPPAATAKQGKPLSTSLRSSSGDVSAASSRRDPQSDPVQAEPQQATATTKRPRALSSLSPVREKKGAPPRESRQSAADARKKSKAESEDASDQLTNRSLAGNSSTATPVDMQSIHTSGEWLADSASLTQSTVRTLTNPDPQHRNSAQPPLSPSHSRAVLTSHILSNRTAPRAGSASAELRRPGASSRPASRVPSNSEISSGLSSVAGAGDEAEGGGCARRAATALPKVPSAKRLSSADSELSPRADAASNAGTTSPRDPFRRFSRGSLEGSISPSDSPGRGNLSTSPGLEQSSDLLRHLHRARRTSVSSIDSRSSSNPSRSPPAACAAKQPRNSPFSPPGHPKPPSPHPPPAHHRAAAGQSRNLCLHVATTPSDRSQASTPPTTSTHTHATATTTTTSSRSRGVYSTKSASTVHNPFADDCEPSWPARVSEMPIEVANGTFELSNNGTLGGDSAANLTLPGATTPNGTGNGTGSETQPWGKQAVVSPSNASFALSNADTLPASDRGGRPRTDGGESTSGFEASYNAEAAWNTSSCTADTPSTAAPPATWSSSSDAGAAAAPLWHSALAARAADRKPGNIVVGDAAGAPPPPKRAPPPQPHGAPPPQPHGAPPPQPHGAPPPQPHGAPPPQPHGAPPPQPHGAPPPQPHGAPPPQPHGGGARKVKKKRRDSQPPPPTDGEPPPPQTRAGSAARKKRKGAEPAANPSAGAPRTPPPPEVAEDGERERGAPRQKRGTPAAAARAQARGPPTDDGTERTPPGRCGSCEESDAESDEVDSPVDDVQHRPSSADVSEDRRPGRRHAKKHAADPVGRRRSHKQPGRSPPPGKRHRKLSLASVVSSQQETAAPDAQGQGGAGKRQTALEDRAKAPPAPPRPLDASVLRAAAGGLGAADCAGEDVASVGEATEHDAALDAQGCTAGCSGKRPTRPDGSPTQTPFYSEVRRGSAFHDILARCEAEITQDDDDDSSSDAGSDRRRQLSSDGEAEWRGLCARPAGQQVRCQPSPPAAPHAAAAAGKRPAALAVGKDRFQLASPVSEPADAAEPDDPFGLPDSLSCVEREVEPRLKVFGGATPSLPLFAQRFRSQAFERVLVILGPYASVSPAHRCRYDALSDLLVGSADPAFGSPLLNLEYDRTTVREIAEELALRGFRTLRDACDELVYKADPGFLCSIWREFWPTFLPSARCPKPLLPHALCKVLHDRRCLQRVYTVNTDGLERAVGCSRSKIVELAGTFNSARCIECGREHMATFMKEKILRNQRPACSFKSCKGLVKPDVILSHSKRTVPHTAPMVDDFRSADCIIAIGMSHTSIPDPVEPPPQKPASPSKGGARQKKLGASPPAPLPAGAAAAAQDAEGPQPTNIRALLKELIEREAPDAVPRVFFDAADAGGGDRSSCTVSTLDATGESSAKFSTTRPCDMFRDLKLASIEDKLIEFCKASGMEGELKGVLGNSATGKRVFAKWGDIDRRSVVRSAPRDAAGILKPTTIKQNEFFSPNQPFGPSGKGRAAAACASPAFPDGSRFGSPIATTHLKKANASPLKLFCAGGNAGDFNKTFCAREQARALPGTPARAPKLGRDAGQKKNTPPPSKRTPPAAAPAPPPPPPAYDAPGKPLRSNSAGVLFQNVAVLKPLSAPCLSSSYRRTCRVAFDLDIRYVHPDDEDSELVLGGVRCSLPDADSSRAPARHDSPPLQPKACTSRPQGNAVPDEAANQPNPNIVYPISLMSPVSGCLSSPLSAPSIPSTNTTPILPPLGTPVIRPAALKSRSVSPVLSPLSIPLAPPHPPPC